MAKKTIKKNQNFWEEYREYIVPSGIGAVIALVFSERWGLSIAVFIAVWIGNWVARELLKK